MRFRYRLPPTQINPLRHGLNPTRGKAGERFGVHSKRYLSCRPAVETNPWLHPLRRQLEVPPTEGGTGRHALVRHGHRFISLRLIAPPGAGDILPEQTDPPMPETDNGVGAQC